MGGKVQEKIDPRDIRDLFHFCNLHNPIPDLEVGHPQGALALATAAASNLLSLTIVF